MSVINIAVTGAEAQAKLSRLAAAVGPRPILKVVGLRLMSYVEESFRTRGRGKWAPLTWSTLALRRRGGDAPLQDTGRYKQSFVTESDQKTYVEVGTSLKTPSGVVLAAIHERGTKPYTIRARQAKVLAAHLGVGAGGAGQHGPVGLLGSGRLSNWLIFGKEVQHPGVPARPVLPDKPTAERLVEGSVNEMLEMEVQRGGGGLPRDS